MGSYHRGNNFFKAHNYLSNRNCGPSLVFIIFTILKQCIVVGCEPIILVLNARFRSPKTSVQILFVQYGRQIERGKSRENRAFSILFH
jgi:hypothetical protein